MLRGAALMACALAAAVALLGGAGGSVGVGPEVAPCLRLAPAPSLRPRAHRRLFTGPAPAEAPDQANQEALLQRLRAAAASEIGLGEGGAVAPTGRVSPAVLARRWMFPLSMRAHNASSSDSGLDHAHLLVRR